MNGRLWLGSTAISLLLLACLNPYANLDRVGHGLGRATISTGLLPSRTVVPDFSNTVDSFDVLMTSHDGHATKSATVLFPDSSHTFDSVESGTWDVAVTAKKDGAVVGGGSATDQVIDAGAVSNINVPIVLSVSGGTGSLSLSVSFPASTGIDYLAGSIEGVPLDPGIQLTGDTSTGTWTGTFVQDGLGEGTYDLVMTFKRGGSTGTDAGIFHEAVNIWTNLTSDHWIDSSGNPVVVRAFSEQEFMDPNAYLQNLVISTSAINFAPQTTGYDVGETLVPKVTITPTQATDGQTIKYRLNGGSLVNIGSGETSAAITLQSGANTVEVQVTAPDRQTVRTYSVAVARTLTVDHTNFDPSLLADEEIARAALLKGYFEHASVGNNIFYGSSCGYDVLAASEPRYDAPRVHWDTASSVQIPVDPTWYDTHTGLGDNYRANPGAQQKIDGFYTSMSDQALSSRLNVASFKFCFVDMPSDPQALFTSVRDTMDQLAQEHPTIVFFWWTMPILRDSSSAGTQTYNDLVRAYCRENGIWLLDIAALESHNEAGDPIVDADGRELLYDGFSDPDGGHLNIAASVRMAKAYWKLMSAIAEATQ